MGISRSGCRHARDAPVCTDNERKAELKPGDVHKHHPCRAGRGTARGLQQRFPWCLLARRAACGRTPLRVWCRLALGPALALPSCTAGFEPKSSKPPNHGLLVGAGSRVWAAAGSGRRCTGRQHGLPPEHCGGTDRSPAPAGRARGRGGAGRAGSFPGLLLPAAGVLGGTWAAKGTSRRLGGWALGGGSWRAGAASGLSQELSSSTSPCSGSWAVASRGSLGHGLSPALASRGRTPCPRARDQGHCPAAGALRVSASPCCRRDTGWCLTPGKPWRSHLTPPARPRALEALGNGGAIRPFASGPGGWAAAGSSSPRTCRAGERHREAARVPRAGWGTAPRPLCSLRSPGSLRLSRAAPSCPWLHGRAALQHPPI